MSVNKVILVGNAGRDPEVRYVDGSGSQSKVATFTLATSERYKDRNGELRENTEWHNIVAWRQSADIAERFIRKGTQVYIEGRLRTRSYTDASGVKKYSTEIVVDTLQLLGRRDDQQGAVPEAQRPAYQPSQPSYQAPQPSYQAPQQAPQGAYQAPQPMQKPAEAPVEILDNDDLPF